MIKYLHNLRVEGENETKENFRGEKILVVQPGFVVVPSYFN